MCIVKKESSLYKKEALYRIVYNDIKNLPNIEVLIKKIKDLDKLKTIFLNKEQILAFDYLEKPTICYSQFCEKSGLLSPIKSAKSTKISDITSDQIGLSHNQKIGKVISYFEKSADIKSPEDNTDKRILCLLDEMIKDSMDIDDNLK